MLVLVALMLLSNLEQIQTSQGPPSMAPPSLSPSTFSPILSNCFSSPHLFTFPLPSPKSKITGSVSLRLPQLLIYEFSPAPFRIQAV